MPKMTPGQEAEYALDFGVARSDLPEEAQLAYDRLAEQRARARAQALLDRGAVMATAGLPPDIMSATEGRRMPGLLRSRASWVASGLILQAVGAVGVAAYVWLEVRHQNIGGHITAATIRLAWHGEVHTQQGSAVLAAGAIIYAYGSILMARPYVARPLTLFVAVPVAAVAGMLVLGVLAFIAALLIPPLAHGDFPFDWPFGGDRRRAKRQRQQ